jgi:hypothetical protein
VTPTERRGADIEIIDRHQGDTPVLLPNTVRINGIEIPIPADAKIKVHEMSDSEAVTVTLTLFARSITIKAEQS